MTRRRKQILLLAAILLGALAALWAGWLGSGPRRLPAANYVGTKTCAACHDEQGRQWRGSHHDLAMQAANESTVLGNFENQSFLHRGIASRLFKENGAFCVHTEGPDGKMETYSIRYTFGVEPLQQYLIEFPRGRLQALSIAWDTRRKRWFHLYPDETIPHDDWLHWTKGGQNWNYMCAECHSTNLEKNYDAATDTYRTTFSEINVGCEACHGPGSNHVAWALDGARTGGQAGPGLAPLKQTKTQLDTCAQCHSRRGIVAPGFRPGNEFLDHYVPELLDAGAYRVYHVDGQIREEAYEYVSFLQSKMYRQGVRCTDCHNPHTARPHAEGNNLCTRCHVASRFDTPAHHRHQHGTAAAACVECHMPAKPFMVVHERRDHSIRIPRPDLSVLLGTPNACNNCHKDRSPEWARDRIVAWYGPERPGDPHFGLALAAGREGKPEGEAMLQSLWRRMDAGPVVRATAALLLGRYTSDAARAGLAQAARSPEPLIRAAAVRGLEGQGLDHIRSSIIPLLEDPVRLVRVEAARALTPVPQESLTQPQRQAFAAAFAEYEASQRAVADLAMAHHNLGLVYANLRRVPEAAAEYQGAVRLDPRFIPSRFNLAMLWYENGDKPAAEKLFREVIALAPETVDAHYSLGLLLAEDPARLAEAAEALGRAARLAPERARVHYNLGLALQHLGRLRDAESALLMADRLAPQTPEYLYALTVFYLQEQRLADARHWADQLVHLNPTNREWRALRQRLEAGVRRPP